MKTLKKIICLIVALLFFTLASLLQPGLNDTRRQEKLTFEEPLQGVPPALVMTTTVLGCFRGIIADVLWLRAIALKEQGKYFEHMQLADWICKLEPRFPSVWMYKAWDMAYNISVELPTGEERWRWVYNGIKLLRDEGIKYNPNSPELYKELAWIFYHKIGNMMDDQHWYYKKVLFEKMTEGLGYPRENLELIAQAPEKAGALLADEKVNALVQEFKSTGVDVLSSFFSLLKEDPALPEPARGLFQKTREDDALKQIEMYCRADYLRTEWKLDPREMLALQKETGPLDWRFPATHSLYWIHQGLKYAPETDTINYDRIAYFSMQDIVSGGRINVIDHEGAKLYLTSPDYRFIGALEKTFEKYIKYYGKDNKNSGIESAYFNFLDNIIWIAYFSGQMDKAARYFQKRFPAEQISPEKLTAFIQVKVNDNIKNASREDTSRTIEAQLEQAWYFYSIGDDDSAALQEKQALFICQSYNNQNQNRERMALPPFQIMKQGVLEKILSKQALLLPLSDILIKNLRARLKASGSI